MCWGKPSKQCQCCCCYTENQILLREMNYRAWVVLLHLRSHHRDHTPSFLWWPGLFFSTIYLSISLYIYMDEQAKEKSEKMFLWSKKTDYWKGPEWDIYVEQQNVDDICFRKETKTLWSRSCQTSKIIITEHGSRLPLTLATCDTVMHIF